ncbi:MAG: DNA polymerase III subunit gamma/tau [Candidatus Infernicultor aquiphilus]|uniref:DNA polymerase III subunit gamma/tau n=1 Tax=Candidatus Infernicultor aquiphilus TaxID=1805029 RepID=A0A2M8C9R0_9BACT|nr:MAG: DNA polymerase III subunit gamma/tau [Candidatus Atribacteria bacterium CG_4_8_14_3_um_filter_34_18]PJB55783.1 MAG: DNA polymerase III subunit gamma/tau [Candidatus Atribacteria bacterium CG_4_9_14_3_um_filter_33_16]
MAYQSLYRKWRPQVFEDIIGQKHITQTLINAISLNRISHAYLFSGPRGVGKTTTARILAKSLNCEKGTTPHPCNKCERCIRITEGYSMDVIEIDGASNRGIDDIRDLRNKVKFAPAEGKYKVYIIDEVHMLTTEAFNALLKTLEEPPSHVVFIFATTAPHKIPNTILSRCQWFNFRRISLEDIINKLKMIIKDEKLEIDGQTLNIIARSSTGSMRDAESILDQIIAYCGKEITLQKVREVLGIIEEDVFFNFVDTIINHNTVKGIEIVNRIADLGGDASQFIKNLMEYVHNLSLIKVCKPEVLNFQGIFTEDRERLLKQSKLIKLGKLFNMVDYLAEVERKMKYTHNPWILLEMLVLKFTAGEDYSSKEIEKDQDEGYLDLSKNQDIVKSDNLKVKTREEIPPKKKIQNKTKEGSFIQTKEVSTNLDLNQVWPIILNKLKKTKMSVYSFIIVNNLITIENDKLIIGFNKKYIFHKESLEKKNNKILLQELIKEEMGRPLAIECIINDDGEEDPSSLEVELENKRKVTEPKNEGEEEIEERVTVEKDKVKKISNNKISEDNLLLKESLSLFKGTIIEEKIENFKEGRKEGSNNGYEISNETSPNNAEKDGGS